MRRGFVLFRPLRKEYKAMKVTLIGKSKEIQTATSKKTQTPYTACDVVLTYEVKFIDGLFSKSFRIFSPDQNWLDSLVIGNEYEAVFDMRGNLTDLL